MNFFFLTWIGADDQLKPPVLDPLTFHVLFFCPPDPGQMIRETAARRQRGAAGGPGEEEWLTAEESEEEASDDSGAAAFFSPENGSPSSAGSGADAMR